MSEATPETPKEQIALWDVERRLKEEALKEQRIKTKRARVELERLQRMDEIESLSDYYYRVRPFNSEVNRMSVRQCIDDLTRWFREDPNEPVLIVFDSPGGGVFEGLALIDTIRDLRAKGMRIDTHTVGMAGSMGGILLQAGEHRTAGENAFMLIHEIGSGAFGQHSALRDHVELVDRLQDKLLTLLAERSTLTKEEIRKRWERRDWWLDAQEMHKLGFIDGIV